MSKIVTALKRTLRTRQDEPSVHFHQGQTRTFPEVCHEDACTRPRLHVR